MKIRFKHVIPALSADEFTQLEANILQDGIRDPLVLWGDVLIDGHNRHEIAGKHGLSFDTVQMDFPDEKAAVEWIILNQFGRRNLPAYERARLALELKPIIAEKAKEQQIRKPESVSQNSVEQKPIDTQKELAAIAGVSHDTIAKVERIEKDAPAEIKAKIKSGDMSINQAYQAIKREEKREEVIAQLNDISSREVKRLTGKYDVIVIDPPWPMEKIERDERPNQSEFDYPTMSEDELSELDIPAADDCHVWLWTTHKFMPMAYRLLDKWGFKYVCAFVWHKPGGFQPYNLPQYNCEFALYARKGTPIFTDTKAFNVCFTAPRGVHSEKPEEFYEVVRRVTTGIRLDMFNRRKIEGFDGWGNESV